MGVGVGYALVPAANGWTSLNLNAGSAPVRVRISQDGSFLRV